MLLALHLVLVPCLLRAAPQQGRSIDQLRSRYTELLVAYQQKQAELQSVDAFVNNLLGTPPNTYRQENKDSAQPLLSLLAEQVRRYAAKLQEKLRVADVSETLRQQLMDDFAQLRDVLHVRIAGSESLHQVVQASKQSYTQKRVLAVDTDLQVVVIAAGQYQQVKAGTRFRVAAGQAAQGVVMKVVRVSAHFAAAMVIEGSLKSVEPGAVLMRLE
jgi:hypothetical protein